MKVKVRKIKKEEHEDPHLTPTITYLNERTIFSDDKISHGVSPIKSKDGIRKGWRYILLIDFDPVRPYRIT